MATHRYWRINITASWGPAYDLGYISALRFKGAVGGTNLSLSGNGTPTGTSDDGSHPTSHAFDENAGTYYRTFQVTHPYVLGWDFGAGNAQFVGAVQVVNETGGVANASYPKDFTIQFSDDGSSWTTALTVAGRSNGYGVSVEYAMPSSLTAALTGPSQTLVSYFGGAAFVAAPSPRLVSAFGGKSTMSAPSPDLVAVGRDSSGENGASLTAPKQTLSSFSGASAKLTNPSGILSLSGTFANLGTAALFAPNATLTAAGRVSGTASAALAAPMATAVGYFGAVVEVSVAGSPTLAASGTSGGIGTARVTAPLFELTASATRQNSGAALLAAPVGRLATTGAAWLIAPGATLTAIGSAVVAVTYEAYALNLKHQDPESPDELTRYTNFPFDRIVRYKNSYFGVNSTGLYLLEGTTDFAGPTPTKVPWAFKTGMTDFESANLKSVNWAYFGGRMAPAATISIHYGDTGAQNYAYATPRGASAQNYRQAFGRGIKSRYYAFEAAGEGELSLDSMLFDVAKMARKV